MNRHSDLAATLLRARDERRAIRPFGASVPGWDREVAYRIQDEGVALRRARGEQVRGYKVGMTSAARAIQLGLPYAGPVVGTLTDAMGLSGDVLPVDELIHPRVEPEIVFHLERDLPGPGVSAADVYRATGWIGAGLEIIDSAFTDFTFTVDDSVADNASSARYLLAPALYRIEDVEDLAHLGCLLEIDGAVCGSGAGANALGHPVAAVAFAANELARRGRTLTAGSVVLTGALCDAVAVRSASVVTATFAALGEVHLRVQHAA